MSPEEICQRLEAILQGLGVEQDPLGKGANYTITFNDDYGRVGGLRIYRNGEQLIGIEKFTEDFHTGKTVFGPSRP